MKEFDTAQVEQLKTIGEYLYQERQERGVSLEEIAVKTYIPLRLLQALEGGQVERLPEPVFVQGFIRRHADAIGLDGTALAKTFIPQPSFTIDRTPTDTTPLEPESSEPMPQAVAEPLPLSIEQPSQIAIEHASRRSRSYLPFVLLGTAAVVLLGVGVVSVLNHSNTDTESSSSETTTESNSSPLTPPSPSTQSKTALSSPAASSSPTANPSGQPGAATGSPSPSPNAAAPSPIQVAVNLTGESWLQVVADGKTAFEGTLKKGDQKTWTAQKKLELQSGNAGAVSISYNQGAPKILGIPGEVKDITYPLDSAPTKTNQSN